MTPEIILGPPGTGKTTSLLGEVESELARGTEPDRIGYVSFTRRAADEAITRAAAKFELTRADLPHFRTLHSLCYQWLNLQRGDVLEGHRVQEFADYAGVRITGAFTEDGTTTGFEDGDRMMHMVNLARVRRIPLRQQYDMDPDDQGWQAVNHFAKCLTAFKAANGLHDYTDMLEAFISADRSPRLEVLFVDEAQDLSRLQWDVVHRLARDARRVVIAGDDDQAIYRWAGADVDALVDMTGDVRVLGQSYRVPPALQRIAAGLIGRVRHRREKVWAARTGEVGTVERASDIRRVSVSGDETVLVLARNTYLLRDIVAPELRARGTVFEWRGHSSIKQGVVEAVVAWEDLRRGRSVTGAKARVVYSHMSSGRGVARGHKTLPQVGDDEHVDMDTLRSRMGLRADGPWYGALDRIAGGDVAYMRRALQSGEKLQTSGQPRVRLSTIHGAKGAEADHVVLLTEVAPRTFKETETSQDDELRVWYVAATRARSRLTVVDPRSNFACPWL